MPAAPDRRGRGVETLEEGADIEPGASHHHGQAAARANGVDAAERLPSEARGVIALVGLDNVEEMMRHRRLLRGRRLSRGHVHAAIDLARVGAHHLDGEAGGEVNGGRGLAHAGGPADDEKRRRGYHVRLSSRLMSLSESRETMGRPCGQKYGVSVAERSERSRVISSRCSGACAFTAARQATKERARSTMGESGFAGGRPHLVEEAFDEAPWLRALEEARHGAEEHAASAEVLEGEAEPLEIFLPLREERRLSRAELEGLGKEESLGGEGAARQLVLELLEEHALVGYVLVDEEHLFLARRDHEGVLELADHVAESTRPERREALPEERPLDISRRQGPGHDLRALPAQGRRGHVAFQALPASRDLAGAGRRTGSAAHPGRHGRRPPG